MMEKKILNWMMRGEVGSSSKAMARAFIGMGGYANYPHDPDDLNRCLLLLDAVPEAREHMGKVAALSDVWARLVDRWDEIEAMFIDEVGLNWCKANSAPKTYRLMRDVIEGVKN